MIHGPSAIIIVKKSLHINKFVALRHPNNVPSRVVVVREDSQLPICILLIILAPLPLIPRLNHVMPEMNPAAKVFLRNLVHDSGNGSPGVVRRPLILELKRRK